MRILFVGGIHKKENRDASRFYTVGNKLVHGLIRSGHQVLHFSDRDVKRSVPFWKRRTAPTQALISKVSLFEPELILFLDADLIRLDAVNSLKPIPMAQINLDPTFHPRNQGRLKKWHEVVDATFITTHHVGLLCGKRTYYLPNPVDRSIESYRAFENPKDYDLFLAHGAYIDDQDPRKLTVDAVRSELPSLRFSYYYIPKTGGIWGQKYYQTLASCRMGLNLTRQKEEQFAAKSLQEIYLYSSDRLSQYMGNGLLIFSQKNHRLDELFSEGKEMIFYDSNHDLIEKLEYYKNHDTLACEIAKNGWEKVHREHSSELVGQFIVDVLTGQPTNRYRWPTSPF